MLEKKSVRRNLQLEHLRQLFCGFSLAGFWCVFLKSTRVRTSCPCSVPRDAGIRAYESLQSHTPPSTAGLRSVTYFCVGGHAMGKLLEMRLVTVVAFVCILNASGVWSEAYPGIFLNIDCGSARTNLIDPLTKLPWYADTSFISTGESSSSVRTWDGYPQINTLRYFNDTRFPKYCYKLPVEPQSTYMLRTEFYYGVYDGGNSAPSFQMTIDGLKVANVTSTLDTAYYYETTYMTKGNTTFLCLLRDQTNANPYISTISLRLVTPYPAIKDYGLSKGFVANTQRRYSFGSSDTPRYPDDVYDRYWESVSVGQSSILSSPTPLQVLNTNRSLVYAGGNPEYQVPLTVLQSALTSSSRMTLTLPRRSGDSGFLFLHFAELNPAVNATSRVFTVNISSPQSEVLLVNPFNDTFGSGSDATGYWFNNQINFTSNYDVTVDFIPTSYSIQGPILNAIEFFEYLEDKSRPKTPDEDALAIDGIKSSLGLGEWTGDPCVPVPHTWVNCSTTGPPTIELVDLSNYNLAGTIPVAFAKLQTLTTLILSGNNLEGELPDLSALTNLRVLDLRDNNLNGSLPKWLGNLKFLIELYMQNNNFTGDIPSALNRPGLTFQYEPGNALVWSQVTDNDSDKINIWVIVGPVIGGAVAVIVAAVVIIYCCVCQRRRSGNDVSAVAEAPAVELAPGRAPNAGGARSFSVAELTRATTNFNREIGKGGFGSVYYGKLPNGVEVAVKVLGNATGHQGNSQGANEFFNEVDVLCRVHHKNLVSLLGFCNETDNQMLVYEYLPQGSLRDRLNASGQLGVFDFKARLNVALHSAQGLEYLHTGCNPCIVHRDVKSSNILLTNTKEAAKVSDFGLSRLFPGEDGSVTVVKGTRGYIDPEYVTTHFLTSKSDVYSFGIVLLELLTGRVPLPSATEPQSDFAWTLCDWVRRTLQSGGDTNMILDPNLRSSHPDQEAVWKLTDTAMMCVEPKSIHRPSMAEVVHELRSALTLEEANTGTAAYTHQQQRDQHKQRYTSTLSDYDSGTFNTSVPSWPAAR